MGAFVDRYREELRRAASPALDRAALGQARIGFDQMLMACYPPREVTPTVDRIIGSSDRPLPIRIYGSHVVAGPAILFFHGGGFVLGSLDSHDGFCRHLAGATQVPVISVGYALAPESPYPAAVEDGHAAAQWLLDNSASLNVNAQQIIVMGDSAGGYIATKVAAAFPEVALQVLLYPALDFTASRSSHAIFGQGYGLDQEMIAFCYDCFLGSLSRHSADVSPVLDTKPLRGAPAIVVVAESDPLRDEGEAYAALLNENGRGAALWDIADTAHGFVAYPSLFPQARSLIERLAETLWSVFSRTVPEYTQICADGRHRNA